MNRVLIITSAAYPGPELEAEFGHVPPAFLPIGNRRLFVHQRAAIGNSAERIVLSLPDSFTPDPVDVHLLAELGIEAVHVPDGLSLGQSIVYVINITATSGGPVAILHGDTLLRGLDMDVPDVVSTGQVPAGYQWGHVQLRDGWLESATPDSAAELPGQSVLSGYFSFSDASLLVQAITRRNGHFVEALTDYAARRQLRAIEAREWLDFGHANTYHQSRGRITTEREFNQLNTTPRMVVKSGRNPDKIVAEARWFDALPAPMRLHAPAFLGLREAEGKPSYALEYLYLPTLSDLYVFGRLSPVAWGRIFDAADEFLTGCAAQPAPDGTAEAVRGLYGDKAMERLDAYARASGVDLGSPCRLDGKWLPSLERLARLAAEAVPAVDPQRHLKLVHGDFCFSNILYDARASLVRVIDPRGLDAAGQFSVFGDLRYDLGKLHHSVVGRYDHIIAGYYQLQRMGPLDFTLELPNDPALQAIEAEFLGRRFAGLDLVDAGTHAICVLLFLSMLPLHSDDPRRQQALLANALRLFLELDSTPALRERVG
jgi:hypothetical protein